MQLSNEDNLRLNVLLAQQLQAVRINEGTMTVHALTTKGEAKVPLNPTTKDEQYLRWVRELLSTKVTGSPGGYPIFLKRWTRMGHTRNNLEQMLLLGEPEAVVAVVHSTDVSHEIGRRAWWADPTAGNARRLLEKPEVAAGPLGKELTAYLMEFLPFEEIPLDVVDTVRLCLQDGLVSQTEREKLWSRAKRKNPFYVGFLLADAKNIPLELKPHPQSDHISQPLQVALRDNNPFANALHLTLNQYGQHWLKTLSLALEKPVDQDVVIALFKAIQKRFNLPFPEQRGVSDITVARQRSEQFIQGEFCPDEIKQLLPLLNSDQLPLLKSLLILGQLGEDTLNNIFAGNDSVGSVMRKRLAPLVKPLVAEIKVLLG
uniref:DsrS n=1 Tax=uncultured Thiotrichaceae bacterium TaxID=298394 RepID=A0A6S6TF67_9GAMM|nr:MAG: Unknown protein [uncultured Thiotrichaceae bacterium]